MIVLILLALSVCTQQTTTQIELIESPLYQIISGFVTETANLYGKYEARYCFSVPISRINILWEKIKKWIGTPISPIELIDASIEVLTLVNMTIVNCPQLSELYQIVIGKFALMLTPSYWLTFPNYLLWHAGTIYTYGINIYWNVLRNNYESIGFSLSYTLFFLIDQGLLTGPPKLIAFDNKDSKL
jgi:hypothetical protein